LDNRRSDTCGGSSNKPQSQLLVCGSRGKLQFFPSLFKSNKSLSKSRAAVRTATERVDAAGENVSLQVHADYVRYLEAYEELKTQQKSVELAERNYRTVFTRYSADMALITDMIDAANSRLDAQQRLVNARINIIYCYYKLLFTSGTI